MSNIYIQEPPTHGKVLIITTVGDIDIELWSKEAPRACRNFIQLCLEGYYDGTIFHRIIRGFIVQGGDPTGTGEGGESVYGGTFKDEFHSRLKFVRRGLVAMANSGPNDNGSQFFFTLDKCDQLNGKHTIFGKVTGQTVYNLPKFADIEVDGDDRPLYPPKIKSTEVLSNPFDDIVPRTKKQKDKKEPEAKKRKSKSKATKNFSLLSFGEEAEEQEVEATTATSDFRTKSKSAHDLSHDPTLLPDIADELETKDDPPAPIMDASAKMKIKEKLKREKEKLESEDKKSLPSSKLDQLKQESHDLMKELKTGKRKQEPEDEKPKKIDISDFKEEKKHFTKRKKMSKGSSREDETLALLAKFQSRLGRVKTKDVDDADEETPTDDSDLKGDDWLAHKLHFDTKSSHVKDANIIDADTYDIFDPRNPMNKRKRGEDKPKGKSKR